MVYVINNNEIVKGIISYGNRDEDILRDENGKFICCVLDGQTRYNTFEEADKDLQLRFINKQIRDKERLRNSYLTVLNSLNVEIKMLIEAERNIRHDK